MRCARKGCGAAAMRNDKYCFFHSAAPETVKRRKKAQKRGGARGKSKRSDSIESVQDVKNVLAEAINELRSSGTQNTIAKTRVIGYLAGVMLAAIEKGDIEERVAQLERTHDSVT